MSDMYYPPPDDLPVALSLVNSDIGRFLVGEINGEVIASQVANPVAEGVFYASHNYVMENYRYGIRT